ncbi:MAG: GIY-YIG nuclease family protein [Massilia sp.]
METVEITVQPASWWLYLLECEGGSIYTGITTDVAARYAKHVDGKGAKYTRAFPPLRILKTVACADYSAALKAEHAIKKMSAAQKRAFCLTEPDTTTCTN